jgi:hypothetical protein
MLGSFQVLPASWNGNSLPNYNPQSPHRKSLQSHLQEEENRSKLFKELEFVSDSTLLEFIERKKMTLEDNKQLNNLLHGAFKLESIPEQGVNALFNYIEVILISLNASKELSAQGFLSPSLRTRIAAFLQLDLIQHYWDLVLATEGERKVEVALNELDRVNSHIERLANPAETVGTLKEAIDSLHDELRDEKKKYHRFYNQKALFISKINDTIFSSNQNFYQEILPNIDLLFIWNERAPSIEQAYHLCQNIKLQELAPEINQLTSTLSLPRFYSGESLHLNELSFWIELSINLLSHLDIKESQSVDLEAALSLASYSQFALAKFAYQNLLDTYTTEKIAYEEKLRLHHLTPQDPMERLQRIYDHLFHENSLLYSFSLVCKSLEQVQLNFIPLQKKNFNGAAENELNQMSSSKIKINNQVDYPFLNIEKSAQKKYSFFTKEAEEIPEYFFLLSQQDYWKDSVNELFLSLSDLEDNDSEDQDLLPNQLEEYAIAMPQAIEDREFTTEFEKIKLPQPELDVLLSLITLTENTVKAEISSELSRSDLLPEDQSEEVLSGLDIWESTCQRAIESDSHFIPMPVENDLLSSLEEKKSWDLVSYLINKRKGKLDSNINQTN